MRPHRRQPTRLLCPWDSPGKNIGVGCHFLLQCMKVKSESEVTQSCPTLSDPMDCSLPGSSVHGIFQAKVLEWGAIAYQATNGVFHRARTNNFTICMEIQKTSNSQSNLEKEEWNLRNQPAWLQALLQSHSHQDSMVLAQRQKYRSMEQNRKPRDKPTHL